MSDTAPRIRNRLDNPSEAIDAGRRNIAWARSHMPILDRLNTQFIEDKPFDGYTIGMAMHVEAKTAVLVETFANAGATVAITGCNPLSTHDDVSAALDATDNVVCYAKRDISEKEYYAAIDAVIDSNPDITIDDGGDLVFRIHETYPDLIEKIIGGCEETTTGVHRLRAMAEEGELHYPMIAVNDTPMKRLFDNVHGTGESALGSIALTTNVAWAGKTLVVAGYGYCGKGIAQKASGQNARVIVTEVEPRRALEAHMAGYEVMPMEKAAAVGEVFITTTGNIDVIGRQAFKEMVDGAILANAGHFNVEIDLETLGDLAIDEREVRPDIIQYEMLDGRCINVLAEGRLVNLATDVALGHPIEVMDQSFGVQAVCVRDLIEKPEQYDAGVHRVPDALDREIAEIKLDAEGIEWDTLTDRQEHYLEGWSHGT